MSTSHLFPSLAYQMAKCPLLRRDLYDLVGDGTSRDSFKTPTVGSSTSSTRPSDPVFVSVPQTH